MGTLRVEGTINLAQFWPKGGSDADTAKIQIRPNQNGFKFRKDGAVKDKITPAFDNAQLIAKGQNPINVIKFKKTNHPTS